MIETFIQSTLSDNEFYMNSIPKNHYVIYGLDVGPIKYKDIVFSILSQDLEQKMLSVARIIDPLIDSLKYIHSEWVIIKGELVLPLSVQGMGIKRMLLILMTLYSSKDHILLIHDIEYGLHYTTYKPFLKILNQVSNELNCQIYMSTCSKEIISILRELEIGTYAQVYKNPKTLKTIIDIAYFGEPS